MLAIREMNSSDIELVVDYWLGASSEYLAGMGADINKLPKKEEFVGMLNNQLKLPIKERNAYCIIWLLDDKPIGHCNTNPTNFGNEANMHLHIWNAEHREQRIGTALLKMTIPLFFRNLELKRLICEPYALNNAPNKTLEKVGFRFEKEYITVPGSINFEQPVNKWVLDPNLHK